jgi:hypothetical protein
MNSIRVQLLKMLPDAEETFGFITKEHRQMHTKATGHHVDAIFIASGDIRPELRTAVLHRKRCVPDGDYQRTKGVRSETSIPAGKIAGFRKLDKVRYMGRAYFIKGRFSTGYAILMDFDGRKAGLKPIPKFSRMTRIEARSSWITSAETIQSL